MSEVAPVLSQVEYDKALEVLKREYAAMYQAELLKPGATPDTARDAVIAAIDAITVPDPAAPIGSPRAPQVPGGPRALTTPEHQRALELQARANQIAANILKDGYRSTELQVNAKTPTVHQFLQQLDVNVQYRPNPSGDPRMAPVFRRMTDKGRGEVFWEEMKKTGGKLVKSAGTSAAVALALGVVTGGTSWGVWAMSTTASSVVRGLFAAYRTYNRTTEGRAEYDLRREAARFEVARVEKAMELSREVQRLSDEFNGVGATPTPESYHNYLAKVEELLSLTKQKSGEYQNLAMDELAEREKKVNLAESVLAAGAGIAGGIYEAHREAAAMLSSKATEDLAAKKLVEAQQHGTTVDGHDFYTHKAIKRAIRYVADQWHPVLQGGEVAQGASEVAKHSYEFHQVGAWGDLSNITAASHSPLHADALEWVPDSLVSRFGEEAAKELAAKAHTRGIELGIQAVVEGATEGSVGYLAGNSRAEKDYRNSSSSRQLLANQFGRSSNSLLEEISAEKAKFSQPDRSVVAPGTPENQTPPEGTKRGSLYDMDDAFTPPTGNPDFPLPPGITKIKRIKILGPASGDSWRVVVFADPNADTDDNAQGTPTTITESYLKDLRRNGNAKSMDPNGMTPNEAAILEIPRNRTKLDEIQTKLENGGTFKLVPNATLTSASLDPTGAIPANAEVSVVAIERNHPKPIIKVEFLVGGVTTSKDLRLSYVFTRAAFKETTPNASPDKKDSEETMEKQAESKMKERFTNTPAIGRPPDWRINEHDAYKLGGVMYVVYGVSKDEVVLQPILAATTPDVPDRTNKDKFIKDNTKRQIVRTKLELAENYQLWAGQE